MANEKNLKKITSEEQAREMQRKSAKKRSENIKARKTMAEELKCLLAMDDTQEKISVALLKEALQGNTKAYEIIRDTIGEKPTDKLDVSQTEPFKIEVEIV